MDLAVIVMGVSGSGKTTVAQALAEQLEWVFYDADDFHPPENVQKMSAGIPLTDEDREPWLKTLNVLIATHLRSKTSLVLACSALKETYRQQLMRGQEHQTQLIYLQGSFETIFLRMQARDHFMKPDMLKSQFNILEEPERAVVVDIQQSHNDIVESILVHPLFQNKKSQ